MDSVSKLEHWLRKNTTEPGLQQMLVSYLKKCGTVQMSDVLPHSMQGTSHQMMNKYAKIAEIQDRLGWDYIRATLISLNPCCRAAVYDFYVLFVFLIVKWFWRHIYLDDEKTSSQRGGND